MTKTITLRLDDEIYRLLKTAAKGEMRTISNFLEYAAIKYLTETRKWSYFLSIMGFITAGILVVVGLIMGFALSLIPSDQLNAMGLVGSSLGFLMGLIYILIAILYLFPTLYLYKFSQKMKVAISVTNNDELEEAFKNQKSFYKFIGIATIISIGIYILFAIFAFLAAFLV